ncbi:CCA tRNA nucleotidyltransferase [Membranicola marinus]|uniref:CCA tRNA nucleotidyltransferase n=1 Tax=Membranihabitans marinus TaxID=1227546 RepID=A0A953LAL0_9BACT|nr:HD domain-containing protein [Membranihabitans marinus]MBY5960075.1 CCA tRNA nucleotidyltransferase [Membranihabitans marinus]
MSKVHLESQEKVLLEKISKAVGELSTEAYVIGGFVRDRILGRPSKDIDIVCKDDGIDLARRFAQDNDLESSLKLYSKYGVAMVRFGDYEIEFVGARKESYSQDSRNPRVEKGSLHDDQLRRDFTINALAFSVKDYEEPDIIDPFDGMMDLEQGIIRTPTNPDRTFSDDPLRIMRAVRFASQLNFELESGTSKAISANAHRLKIVSQERLTVEFNKILLSSKPSVGLALMEHLGLMPYILPELSKMNNVEVVQNKGHKNNFYHTIEVVDNVAQSSDSLWLRWAALLHDIGKPRTKRFEKDHGWTFHGHEVVGARMVKKIFKRMRLPLDHKMKYVAKLVRLHLRPIALVSDETSDSAIRRLLFDAGDDIDDLMVLCEADITSKNEYRVKTYLNNYKKVRQRIVEVEEKDHLRNWQPPIDGQLIMDTFGIKPSRQIGEIKTAIREAILEGDIENTYEAAYAFMIQEGEKLGLRPVK